MDEVNVAILESVIREQRTEIERLTKLLDAKTEQDVNDSENGGATLRMLLALSSAVVEHFLGNYYPHPPYSDFQAELMETPHKGIVSLLEEKAQQVKYEEEKARREVENATMGYVEYMALSKIRNLPPFRGERPLSNDRTAAFLSRSTGGMILTYQFKGKTDGNPYDVTSRYDIGKRWLLDDNKLIGPLDPSDELVLVYGTNYPNG